MESRRIELVCGVLGGALGLIALGVSLFAPVYLLAGYCDPIMMGSRVINCPYYSAVQLAVLNQGVALLSLGSALCGVPSLGIILFAIWHSRARSRRALVLLWGCTVLLSLATLLFGLSPLGAFFGFRLTPLGVFFGVFFVPACVLALGASIAGTVAAQHRIPAQV